jgi:hypothetical protein
MVCEAVQAGHQPLLLPASALPPGGKLARSLGVLRQQGLLVDAAPQAAWDLSALPPRGSANGEYERLRGQVREYLGLT